jgi:hypothetical protein
MRCITWILGLILAAGVASAQPVDWQKANEEGALLGLQMIQDSQTGRRINDQPYWTGDIAGLYVHGTGAFRLAHSVAQADANPRSPYPEVGDTRARNGYWFRAMSTDPSGKPYRGSDAEHLDTHPTAYGVCAYPDVYGKSGSRTYIMNETGAIWGKDTEGKAVLAWPEGNPGEQGWTRLDEAPAPSSDAPDAMEPVEVAPTYSASEQRAIAAMKMLLTVQKLVRQADLDRNGAADFWTGDIAGLYGLRKEDGSPVQQIPRSLAQADAEPLKAWDSVGDTGTPYHGYLFQVVSRQVDDTPYRLDEDGDGRKTTHTSKFAICARPAAWGKDGIFTFILDESGTLWARDNAGATVSTWPATDPGEKGWIEVE